ncbi:hypothetical protein [Clostridium beijerinckii]|uniref:Uncharacterized protein n=1 Tax=Clostridium beijerinckii TaxID=1520 RepID=A0A1S8SAD3_CLOBE|nr:hypothetical protein [Clostridium beijerinckii]MBE6089535.1 hypothetical protein [Clostridium beijerinckii]NRY60882.1 NADH:ubiquinone oxidoreductase subunit C [Clostridium beijerinckii]OOM62324.1 hypothetical protein CLBCK_18620 [Clostridium beijerinckii]
MSRNNLREVEVLDTNQKVEYIAYFHGFYTQTYSLDNRNDLRVIVELESGELRIKSIYDIRFIN